MHRPARHLPAAALVAAAGLFAASPALAGDDRVRAAGELVRYSPAVPEAATASVHAVYDTTGDSTVTWRVRGLRPLTRYGAHPHAEQCRKTVAAPGPHAGPDPERPLANPAFAGPGGMIWLTIRTDARGRGVARTKVPWQFSPDWRPRSVMIHAEPTSPGPTGSAIAGASLACLTVRF